MSDNGTSLKDRNAIVTGAGRGIGRAIATGLAQAGARVVLVARSLPELNETAALISELGGEAVVISADLSERAELSTVAERAAAFGPVDILINNAAVVEPLGSSDSVDPAQWAAAIEVNLIVPTALSLLLLAPMRRQRWGRIVNVSSSIVAHPQAMPGMNAYVTSKSALEAHTINLAAELADSGITVNVFRPGSVDTSMQAWIRAQDPMRIGVNLHDRFAQSYESGALITAHASADALLAHLGTTATGQIWQP